MYSMSALLSTMIENLFQNDRVSDYVKLVDGFLAFLHMCKSTYRFSIYKYLGDGFILLFEDRECIDDILKFCDKPIYFSGQLIDWFKTSYLDSANLPREGITIGIAVGRISEIATINIPGEEYVGRAINVACRLQKSLIELKHTNKVLLHTDAYSLICGHL